MDYYGYLWYNIILWSMTLMVVQIMITILCMSSLLYWQQLFLLLIEGCGGVDRLVARIFNTLGGYFSVICNQQDISIIPSVLGGSVRSYSCNHFLGNLIE